MLPSQVSAQSLLNLPQPGVMVHQSPSFAPAILKGIKVYPDNPFRFDFILNQGDSLMNKQELEDESLRLIKYFMASLTVPEKDLWVNLSPNEPDRIIPESFGSTEMGRDLLGEDYLLKQLTASLIYPEDELGKTFWDRVYQETARQYGVTDIPVNTFNKVWIVPEKAVVYENTDQGTAYVVESRLKVILEEDYILSVGSEDLSRGSGLSTESAENQKSGINSVGSQIVREIVLPALTQEINHGKNFTKLRQVYQSLILAAWYKKKIKNSILSQVYSDQNKIVGVNIDDPQEKQKIYELYLEAFNKGVYDFIKEDFDFVSQKMIPRKYFAGGFGFEQISSAIAIVDNIAGPINSDRDLLITTGINVATEDFKKSKESSSSLKLSQHLKKITSSLSRDDVHIGILVNKSKDPKELGQSLIEIMSTEGFRKLKVRASYISFLETNLIFMIVNDENALKKAKQLLADGVLENIAEIMQWENPRRQGEGFAVTKAVFQSEEIGPRAERSVIIISRLSELHKIEKNDNDIVLHLVKALSTSDLEADTDGVVAQFLDFGNTSSEDLWRLTTKQMTEYIESGNFKAATEKKTLLISVFLEFLKDLAVGEQEIEKVRFWANEEDLDIGILEEAISIAVEDKYIDSYTIKLFLARIMDKNSRKVKKFLNLYPKLSDKLSAIDFLYGVTRWKIEPADNVVIQQVLGHEDSNIFASKVIELISLEEFERLSRNWPGALVENILLSSLMQSENPIQQIDQLLQPKVLGYIRAIIDRELRSPILALVESFDDSFFELSREILHSKALYLKAERAVKIFNRLDPFGLDSVAYWGLATALSAADLQRGTDGVLDQVAGVKKRFEVKAFKVIIEQMIEALQKDDFDKALNKRSFLTDTLGKLLADKGVESDAVKKSKAWAASSNIPVEVLEDVVDLMANDNYLDEKNLTLFLPKLWDQSSEKAKEFLAAYSQLSEKLKELDFDLNREETSFSGLEVIEKFLEYTDTTQLSKKLLEITSINGFGQWVTLFGKEGSKAHTPYPEQMFVLHIVNSPDPVQQIDRLMVHGVMPYVAELMEWETRQGNTDRPLQPSLFEISKTLVNSEYAGSMAFRSRLLVKAFKGLSLKDETRAQIIKTAMESKNLNVEKVVGLANMMIAKTYMVNENEEKIPITKKEFTDVELLWEDAETLEEYQLLLSILVHTFKIRRDFTHTYAFLQKHIDKIIKDRKKTKTRDLNPLEMAVVKAVNDTQEKDILLPFLLRTDLSIEFKEYLLEELSGFVLDKDVFLVYTKAKKNNRIEEFLQVFLDFYYEKEFNIYPPAIALEYLLDGKITFEDLKNMRKKVKGLTFSDFLKLVSSEGESDEKLLLTYFIFNQPDLNYGYSFTFSLFRDVAENARKSSGRISSTPEIKKKLRDLISRHVPDPESAKEIISAMDEGRVILPRSSGMVDENREFIPQGVNISFEDSTALEDSREAFIDEYNQHFTVLLEILYLAKSIRGILKNSDDQLLKSSTERLISSVQQTGDINIGILDQLRQAHVQALMSLPQFSDKDEQTIQNHSVAEIQKFYVRLKKKSLNHIYGFQDIFRHYRDNKSKDKDTENKSLYKQMLGIDFDLMHNGYLKRDSYSKDYEGVDTFGTFVHRTFEMIKNNFITSQFSDVLENDTLDGILRETLGHFKDTADLFEDAIEQNSHKGEQKLSEFLYLSLLAKKDVIKFARLGDGVGCCISSNKAGVGGPDGQLLQQYAKWMGTALIDDGLQGILIHTRKKPVGFIVWHFAQDKEGNMIIPTLNLYLKSEYHSNQISRILWKEIQKILAPLGVKTLGISPKTYGSGKTPIPDFFSGAQPMRLSRFQTYWAIVGPSHKPLFSTALADLSEYGPNTFYSRDLHTVDMTHFSNTNKKDSTLNSQVSNLIDDKLIDKALSTAEVIQKISGEQWQLAIMRKIRGELSLRESSAFTQFIKDVELTVNVMRPPQEELSTWGLAVETGKKGKDVYATSKSSEDQKSLEIFVSEYGWSAASDDVKREIIAHQLYKAFTSNHSFDSSEHIDLELLIDAEISQAKEWQSSLDLEERDDLDLGENLPSRHLRARAFARLMGAPSEMGAGSLYTDFLRLMRKVGLNFGSVAGTFDKPGVIATDGKFMNTLLYVLSHRRDSQEFIEEKLRTNDVLYWNYANPSEVVFRNITKTLSSLVRDGEVQNIILRVGKDQQSIINEFINNQVPRRDRLMTLMDSKMFPELLSDSLKSSEAWLDFFDAVSLYNRIAAYPIKVVAVDHFVDLPARVLVEDEKTVVVQYYDQLNFVSLKEGSYNLVHVDPEIGFTETQYNGLSYVLNNDLSSRADFGLEVTANAPFLDEEIQMMSSLEWQNNAIEAFKATSDKDIPEETIQRIRERFSQFGDFDIFNLYDGVMVSIPGDDGDGDVTPSGGGGLALQRDVPEVESESVGIPVASSPGGVDFNMNQLNLDIRNNGKGIEFKLDPTLLHQLQEAPGFTPFIINIQPITNLRLFLGMNTSHSSEDYNISSKIKDNKKIRRKLFTHYRFSQRSFMT